MVATRDVRVPLLARVALAALQMAAEMPELRLSAHALRFRTLLYVGLGFAVMARADTDIHLILEDIGVTDENIWIRMRTEKGTNRNFERSCAQALAGGTRRHAPHDSAREHRVGGARQLLAHAK